MTNRSICGIISMQGRRTPAVKNLQNITAKL
nr:MAG TPA: hypothetical protein [Caudoviricetes sp.]